MSQEYVQIPLSDLQEMGDGVRSAIGSSEPMSFNDLKLRVANSNEIGYTPVKGVDYYTEADKQELIAELEETISNKGQWEVIEKICFGYELLTEKPADWDTAKTTKYYYSNANSSKLILCESWLTWESNKYWKYTGEFDSQIQKIQRNQEPDGTPYNFKSVSVFGHIFNTAGSGLWCFSAYLYANYASTNSLSGVATLGNSGTTYPYHFNYRVTQQSGIYDLVCYSGQQGNYTAATGMSNASSASMMIPVTAGNIKAISFHIYNAKQYYSEGDYIEIWGVRADG